MERTSMLPFPPPFRPSDVGPGSSSCVMHAFSPADREHTLSVPLLSATAKRKRKEELMPYLYSLLPYVCGGRQVASGDSPAWNYVNIKYGVAQILIYTLYRDGLWPAQMDD